MPLIIERRGEKYEGKRITNMSNPDGRPAFIDLKSIEAQIIADAMESGFEAAKALILVNGNRQRLVYNNSCPDLLLPQFEA
jgi:hypothetical protein